MMPIVPLQPDELSGALAYLLALPSEGRLADARYVRSFREYLEHSSMRWEGLRCGSSASPAGLFLSLLLPGSTAIVMIPPPGELGIASDAQREVSLAGLARLADYRLHYVQALLLPEAEAQARLLAELGFHPLAPLVYLERDAKYPWVDPPNVAESDWVKFSAQTYDEFAATLLATYGNSLDCPELTGLRPIGDIIAAHQASGQFDPAWWELLHVDGQAAGCLLLARLARASAAEVVYMAVVPEFRRAGIGALLLRRALQHCRDAGIAHLTLVVDERNHPARRLYDRFALQPVARRQAYFYRWPMRADKEDK